MTKSHALHALAAVALVATAVQPAIAEARASVTLDTVIAFDNPSDPWLSEASDRIFSSVWTKASTQLAVPGIGLTKVSTTAAGNGWVANDVPISGDWHGLRMTGFSLNGMPQSGVGSYVLHFADAPGQVVGTLDAMGFPVTGVGKDTRTGDADCGTKLRVDGEGLGSSFTISFAC